ncbi:response regulator [Paenibacillus macerans]|uniref:response regulator n=1 Tax=Paenibacillus macerans TaxID=44252 RepID=UPI003D321F67
MRVLIVDDEEIIREGLRTLISWSDAGFEQCVEAENGKHALEVIGESVPDLIITDIFMPEMSGIEFAQQVKEEYPSVRFIILTGYEKFEYAKQAVDLGVDKFMVKPVFPEELLEAVREITADIRRERFETLLNAETLQKLEEYRPMIVDKFWNDLVHSEAGQSEHEIRRRGESLHVKLNDQVFCAAIKLNAGQVANRYDRTNMTLIKYAVRNIAEEVLDGKWSHFVDGSSTLLFGIFNTHLEKQAFEAVVSAVENTLGLGVSIGVGRAYGRLAETSVSAREGAEAAQVQSMSGEPGVLWFEDMPNWKKDQVAYPYAQEQEIMECLRYKDGVGTDLFGDFAAELEKQGASAFVVKLMFMQLLVAVYRVADEYRITEQLPSFYDSYSRLNELDSLQEICGLFDELGKQIIAHRIRHQSGLVDQLVNQAQAVIEERYSQIELTVSVIAGLLSITPNYLSRIFHQKTGSTCIEYITSVRVEQAKKLLSSSPMKSYQIAEQVGYANTHYFSALFKKNTGLSPSEYRDEQREGKR